MILADNKSKESETEGNVKVVSSEDRNDDEAEKRERRKAETERSFTCLFIKLTHGYPIKTNEERWGGLYRTRNQ